MKMTRTGVVALADIRVYYNSGGNVLTQRETRQPGAVVHPCSSSTWMEIGGPELQGQVMLNLSQNQGGGERVKEKK